MTLGETLFPKETTENKYHGGVTVFFTRIYQANSTLEIEDRLFLLKRSTYDMDVDYIAFCLEKIFEGLTSPHLVERIQKWFPVQAQSDDYMKFAKEARESIGKLALEVFFETIFDCNKKAFWGYLSRPENLVWREEHLYPISLCVFINYLTRCNEATRHNQKSNIRKFLKNVCDEPLEIADNKIGIYHWTEGARQILADALVANGMYEECIEYSLPEAILPLKLKFLGSAFTETDDGLIAISHTGHTTSAQIAMEKACKDREWRHIWSVLSVMEYKYERAHFMNIRDPAITALSYEERGKLSPRQEYVFKLALVFMNGFGGGLQGL